MWNHLALRNGLQRILPESALRAIRQYRYEQSFARYSAKQITRSFAGYDLTLELLDPLAEGWYAHDWALPPEIPLLEKSRLKPGARVFDLGAHQCVMAMLLTKRVGPNGFVLAVEGSSLNANAGRRNIQLNSIPNCAVIHGVVSLASGEVRFANLGNGAVISGKGRKHRSHQELVQTYSVDDLAALHGFPDVIYMDVEGSECDALAGAAKTFQNRPDWFIEVHQGIGLEERGGSVERLLSHFAESYRCYCATPTTSNDYSDWNAFELLDKGQYPADRFYLVALANYSA
jgi:FkbM family methyltransferase